ncbi:hypothetical protein M406DRAFT_102140 [Cryphonectria parasitica EP155]|uniref:Uncharacterized protein n=1 Tax=Cryphonectria parasitica (strain ATCC 38755 / EP155) TaxID=660469 RepID=A0A9P5CS79_CRYP1|nr:uncharacterized protein M406DRAFT_102140 [Cryphonectria parasitica EP155]KAF3767870.1 hypothetical protein M406DRAFT_102140 [Cryphonectria parasitica EP155]
MTANSLPSPPDADLTPDTAPSCCCSTRDALRPALSASLRGPAQIEQPRARHTSLVDPGRLIAA